MLTRVSSSFTLVLHWQPNAEFAVLWPCVVSHSMFSIESFVLVILDFLIEVLIIHDCNLSRLFFYSKDCWKMPQNTRGALDSDQVKRLRQENDSTRQAIHI